MLWCDTADVIPNTHWKFPQMCEGPTRKQKGVTLDSPYTI